MELLRKSGPHILVGAEAESPREFYMIEIPNINKSHIGVICSGFGIPPKALLDETSGRILVGHDDCATSIALDILKTQFSERLPAVFFEFVEICPNGSIVLVHELGVLKLDLMGRKIWAVDTDVISGFSKTSDGVIEMKEMDTDRTIRVSLSDGNRIPQS